MSREGRILVYGATGYTGKLTARMARDRGLTPILAGRSEDRVRAIATELGLEWRAFGLGDTARLEAALADVAVVLHIAGPFSATSRPMVDACIRTNTHYLDITGEIDVFEALANRDGEARLAGIMLLPGVGFDVVPSDCLAAHMKRRMPDARDLKIYIGGMNGVSRGTAKTMVEGIAEGTRVRRGGELETLEGVHEDLCDFGAGSVPTFAVSWGDVSTAWHSTRIPNIEVHFEAVPQLRRMAKIPGMIKSILGLGFMQAILKRQIDRMPEGPTDEQRRQGRATLVAVARNDRNETLRTRLTTPEGYTLTAMTGLAIAERVSKGEFKTGFQTPSLAFGADFITGFENVRREDLNA